MHILSVIKKDLLYSQVSLTGLLICSLIIPSVVFKNGGVSNFGNHLSTVAPYTLSFLLSALFLCLAANKIAKLSKDFLYIAYGLVILSILQILVLISTFPRHISYTYSDIHDDLGIALFAFAFIVSLWLVRRIKNYKTVGLLLFQIAGSLIGLLSILKIIHFLFIGQMIGALGFGLLLVILLPRIIEGDIKHLNE